MTTRVYPKSHRVGKLVNRGLDSSKPLAVELRPVAQSLGLGYGRLSAVGCSVCGRCKEVKTNEELLTFLWVHAWLSVRESCLRRPPTRVGEAVQGAF